MQPVLSKKQMTEEDIKLQYITPALTAKWSREKITMETPITDGQISLEGKLVFRKAPKKADYILYLRANHPIAVVEAKDNTHSVSHGLQQAMEYAQMLDVPFAFSSNGDGFSEHDFLTGAEREFSMDQFPTEAELIARYEREVNQGQGLTPAEAAAAGQPYYSSQTTYPPRYYQRVAINRTVDAIVRGQQRLLLVMATGTGKTYTAFQIAYRLLKSGLKRKVLYLADRNILVDQSIEQDFAPLAKTIHKINFAKDDPVTITSYEVYFSLYQQLTGDSGSDDEEAAEDDTVSRLAALFQRDFFDLIIVDECHRGSAKRDSSWRKILDYFSSATQIGMTATPKETKYISKLIVLDQMIGSMTEFKQIIGRGTRLREKDGKTHFVVMDFRNVTRLFADPDWDGPIEQDSGFDPNGAPPPVTPPPDAGGPSSPPGRAPKPIVDANGCKVEIIHKTVSVYDSSGKLLRQESILDELDLSDYEESHAFGEIYETILKELQSAGSSGEFYTPRPLTDFMAQMIRPRIGERMADFACGTGGFIISWLKELQKQIQSTADAKKYGESVYGVEKKQFPYMLCITNLLLHDLDVPQVYHENSLLKDVLDYTEADQFNVILMNPPYGGSEKADVKNHFPNDLASSETADLFLSVIMYRLAKDGRAAVILPDGFLFGTDNAKINIKKKLLGEFNLHTVIRMPGSVFSPYTSITTNILFFDRTGPTQETWFYRLDMPEGYKHFSKTKPIKLEHFAPVVEWWKNKQELAVNGFDKAKKFTVQQLTGELRYNLDQCGYPHEEEEILAPLDLIQRYEEERSSLNTEIDQVLTEITAILGGGTQ